MRLGRTYVPYTQPLTESPLLTDVGIKFDRKTFFPGFFKQNVFQHDGGRESEVDNAWESLGCNSECSQLGLASKHQVADMLVGPGIVVPPDVGEAAGLTGRARMPGSEDYFGFVEVLHQLHCLNLVRKALYYNFEHYSAEGKHPFGAPPDILKLHVAHCLETVRQQLVCAADFNLLGYVHVQDAHPMPDFATQHVCRNFEDIRQWAVDHEDVRLADMPASLLQARPGDIVLAESP